MNILPRFISDIVFPDNNSKSNLKVFMLPSMMHHDQTCYVGVFAGLF